MSEQRTIDKILLIVGKTQGEVDGINRRLDRMNGTIISHEKRINKNETANDTMKGKMAIIGSVAGVIASGIVAIGVWFFKRVA